MPKLLSVNDLCDTLRVSRSTIYEWRKEGKLPEPIKRWGSPRYDWEDVKKAFGESPEQKKIQNCPDE